MITFDTGDSIGMEGDLEYYDQLYIHSYPSTIFKSFQCLYALHRA